MAFGILKYPFKRYKLYFKGLDTNFNKAGASLKFTRPDIEVHLSVRVFCVKRSGTKKPVLSLAKYIENGF
ncbi:MAG: hypothetical protein CL529_11550 [Aequorivita sp.]|nr:hypothetical protein [Aequorivita sp.]